MDPIIRLFKQEDEEQIKSLIKEFKEYEAQFEEAFRTDNQAVDELFTEEFVSDKNIVYVAEVAGDLIGFVTFHEVLKNDLLIVKNTPALYIAGLFVRPTYRGNGIAQKLMLLAEEYAQKNSIKFLKLIAFTKNQLARDFYFASGYDDYESTMIKKLA